MKRVLVLSGNTYVGTHIAAAFYHTGEYDVAVTLSLRDGDEDDATTAAATTTEATAASAASSAAVQSCTRAGERDASCDTRLPAALQPYVTSVVPRHDCDAAGFARGLLDSDVVIAVLHDGDAYEAARACRVLRGAHYDVEKTFVLVSSLLAWADTQLAARATARRRGRAHARDEFRDAYGDDEPLPPHLREEHDDEDDDEDDLVVGGGGDGDAYDVLPVMTEAHYKQRVAHPRYDHWRRLEHAVKRANSATLHTTVVVAGLPYGDGAEGVLHEWLRRAWHQTTLPQYGAGDNVVPMIHVRDLATVVLRVGDAYDMPEERYVLAVDRAQTTQRELLYAIQRSLGGRIVRVDAHETTMAAATTTTTAAAAMGTQDDVSSAPCALSSRSRAALTRLRARYGDDAHAHLDYLLSHVRTQPVAALSLVPEEAWVALDGVVAHMGRVVYEFVHARRLPPLRLLVTGPPYSGCGDVAHTLATARELPCVGVADALRAYKAHARELRSALHALLLQRLLRRRAQRRLREAQQHVAELDSHHHRSSNNSGGGGRQPRAAPHGSRDSSNDDDNDDDDAGDDDEADGDVDGNDDDDEDEATAEQRRRRVQLRTLLLTCATVDTPDDVAAAAAHITERYLRGTTAAAANSTAAYDGGYNNNDDDDDYDNDDDVSRVSDVDEEMEETDEDGGEAASDVAADDVDDVNDVDAEGAEEAVAARRARRRARAATAARDLRERIRIRELRDEYTLACAVLSMRRVPLHHAAAEQQQQQQQRDEEDEEEEDNDSSSSGDKGSRDGVDDDDDELQQQQQQQQQSDGDDDAEASVSNSDGSDGDADADDDKIAEERASDAAYTTATTNTTTTTAAAHANKHDSDNDDGDEDVSVYDDEALALCVRWRLRQADCRHRGYVMHSFPTTVRQARLLFRAARTIAAGADNNDGNSGNNNTHRYTEGDDGDEDKDGGDGDTAALRLLRARTRLPRRVEDVPPPLDAEFVVLRRQRLLREEQRRQRHEQQQQQQQQDADEDDNNNNDDDDVLAAVDEAIFPDHVLVLECGERALRQCATAAAAAQQQLLQAHQHSHSNDNSNNTATATPIRFVRVAHHNTPYSTASRTHTLPVDDDGGGSGAHSPTVVTPMRITSTAATTSSATSSASAASLPPPLPSAAAAATALTAQRHAQRRDSSGGSSSNKAYAVHARNGSNSSSGSSDSGNKAAAAAAAAADTTLSTLVYNLSVFDAQLEHYRSHHRRDGSVHTSLLTWLLSVATTEACGAAPPLVRVRHDKDVDGADAYYGDDAGNNTMATARGGVRHGNNNNADGDDDDDVGRARVQVLSPPRTSRTATMTFVQLDTPSPPPTTSQQQQQQLLPAPTANNTLAAAVAAATADSADVHSNGHSSSSGDAFVVCDAAKAAVVVAEYVASKLPPRTRYNVAAPALAAANVSAHVCAAATATTTLLSPSPSCAVETDNKDETSRHGNDGSCEGERAAGVVHGDEVDRRRVDDEDGVCSTAATTTTADAAAAVDEVAAEHDMLQRLRAAEQSLRAELEAATMCIVRDERCALRALQLAESCVRAPTTPLPRITREQLTTTTTTKQQQHMMVTAHNTHNAAAAPLVVAADDGSGDDDVLRLSTDAYLMTYVLPTLTPAMARVTRLRPRNAVMALADMLYTDKRRTTL